MKNRSFSVTAIAFCLTATSQSLSGGAEAGDVLHAQVCEEIDRKVGIIEEQRKMIRDNWWPKQQEVWRIEKNAEVEMKKIQDKRRSLGCTDVRLPLERSDERECARLARKRMGILREKEEIVLALSREMEPLKQQLDLIDEDLPRLYKTKERCAQAKIEIGWAYTDEYIRSKGWTRLIPDEERKCEHEMACLDKESYPRELAECGSSGTFGEVIQNRSSHNACIAKDCLADSKQTISNNFGKPVPLYRAIFPTYECRP